MKKTILTPKTAQELNNWVKLLKEAEAEYRLIPFGQKPARVEVDEDVAEEVLGIETKKPMSIAAKIGIGIAAFFGFSFFASLLMVGLTDTSDLPDTPAKPKYTYDYTQIMGKTKDELVAVFGEPVNEYEFKEDCPTGNCGSLDFKGGLAVFIKGGKAYRFEFEKSTFDVSDPLKAINVSGQPIRDFGNEMVSRWDVVNGMEVVITKLDDKYGYFVKKLTEEEKAKAERRRKIQALFDANGELPALRETIMNRMHDSWSYSHQETRYDDSGTGDTFPVECTFRGKNAFGSKVLTVARATIDMNGNVLEFSILN